MNYMAPKSLADLVDYIHLPCFVDCKLSYYHFLHIVWNIYYYAILIVGQIRC